MKKIIYCLGTAVLLYGCAGNQKKAGNDTGKVSINKVWVFEKIDTAKSSNLAGSSSQWIGSNTIDMSHKDTLRYSTIATQNGATLYPYKVSGGYIYLGDKRTYKVEKLTDSIMELSAIYQVKEQSGGAHESTVVMIYKER